MKRKLESMEDLLQAVEYYGFLPFFPNDIPGFSVEEMCAPAYWFAERPRRTLGVERPGGADEALRVRQVFPEKSGVCQPGMAAGACKFPP